MHFQIIKLQFRKHAIPGRKSTILNEHLDFIDAKMEENDELTSPGKFDITLKNEKRLSPFTFSHCRK